MTMFYNAYLFPQLSSTQPNSVQLRLAGGVPGQTGEYAARALEAPARVHDCAVVHQQHVARLPGERHAHLLHHLHRRHDSILVQELIVAVFVTAIACISEAVAHHHRSLAVVPAVVPAREGGHDGVEEGLLLRARCTGRLVVPADGGYRGCDCA